MTVGRLDETTKFKWTGLSLVIASAKLNYNHSSAQNDHDDEKSELYKSRLMVKDLDRLPRL